MTRKLGKIGVYGTKTRALQRRISFEAFGLTFKNANVYKYLGDRSNDTPDIDDIHTRVFYEVPDRAYAEEPIGIPLGMDFLMEGKVDFGRLGLINPLQDETIFRVHIDDFEVLERELIIGDVFEIDFFRKDGKRAFWEITDVDLRSEYEKFIAVIHAVPLEASRKTREIPVDRGIGDVLDFALEALDEEVGESVPTTGTSFTPDELEPTTVDYRTDVQEDFLDDPNKVF